MEVRTGKTLTALSVAEEYGATRVLFVTKKKAIQSIQDDYDKLCPSYLITTINYESLHNVFLPSNYDLIILDEAHTCSQYPTPAERTRLLKKICQGLPIIFLSGTPSPESFAQLFHQFWISSFSPFKQYQTFYAWAKDYVNMKKKYYFNREINDYSDADQAKIEEATKHLFISFTQAEAGFQQEIKEEVLFVKMQPATYALAEKLRKNRVYVGKDGQEILADTAVKLMQKTHQIYSGSVRDEKGNATCFDYSKVDFIKQHFKGKKIAIFYKFRAEGLMLVMRFGIDNLTESPEEFNASENKIFYSQIQSGREGTNLSTADVIVMYNIDFSAVSYLQARARMQTKDRTKEALLCWIFADNGIEQNIYERVSKKMDYTWAYFRKDYGIKNLTHAGVRAEKTG